MAKTTPEFVDDTVRVSAQTYEQLQQLWDSNRLVAEHSPVEAYQAACQLQLQDAAAWILSNLDDYERGLRTWYWGLDTETFDGNVICYRAKGLFGATALTNVPRSVVHSSPDGHEWSYSGSGPQDLALVFLTGSVRQWMRAIALNVLKVGCCSRTAWRLKHKFCAHFIASMPTEGGTISALAIREWILQHQDSPSSSAGSFV